MRILLTAALVFAALFTQAQEHYQFEEVIRNEATEIKSQDRTGTCWCFSASSFIESEALRAGLSDMDLSEMYIVRNIYVEKALNYVRRQGKTNFSEGALGTDFLNAAKKYGLMPESAYGGIKVDGKYNHAEMERVLKGYLEALIKNNNKKLSEQWLPAYEAILDAYMGPVPESFDYEGKRYDAMSFATEVIKFNTSDYVALTSFTHEPYYEPFVLRIPDNFSSSSYINLPLDEMMLVMDEALKNGYTVEWDGDVGERGFVRKAGVAILPSKSWDDKSETEQDSTGFWVETEMQGDADFRQKMYENYQTTDDHLMHVVGMAKDQNGTDFYIVKNSWGNWNGYDGYYYMSRPYMEMKTVSIIVHKDAVEKSIAKKIGM